MNHNLWLRDYQLNNFLVYVYKFRMVGFKFEFVSKILGEKKVFCNEHAYPIKIIKKKNKSIEIFAACFDVDRIIDGTEIHQTY